ncbi:hypothetical protein V8G54_020865 [Vigna mungo]|uniref:Uncharacterized protein n=1 Tax=Vigna mungo TaxID=3915 RepID=A0AAQ3RWU7_VIGMU
MALRWRQEHDKGVGNGAVMAQFKENPFTLYLFRVLSLPRRERRARFSGDGATEVYFRLSVLDRSARGRLPPPFHLCFVLQGERYFGGLQRKGSDAVVRRSRIVVAVLALLLLHSLLFSLYSVSHEQSFSGETSLPVSRELLSSSFASFSTSMNKKHKTKDVELSLRKAPSSIPNPTQN